MLHRLAVGLRRFFKFSTGKNRLPVSKCAQVAAVPEGKEKISEGDKCEPKGSQWYDTQIKYSGNVIKYGEIKEIGKGFSFVRPSMKADLENI